MSKYINDQFDYWWPLCVLKNQWFCRSNSVDFGKGGRASFCLLVCDIMVFHSIFQQNDETKYKKEKVEKDNSAECYQIKTIVQYYDKYLGVWYFFFQYFGVLLLDHLYSLSTYIIFLWKNSKCVDSLL